MVANTATGEGRDLDAHWLALAWIYGDVVRHDTERRKEGDPFELVHASSDRAPMSFPRRAGLYA
ncbi:hypothetical protein OG389_00735 [Streptomyces sp. NBC_00435]|uniref:hypothetical protein n=1 Tax=Streptomyces sp. NBC_00435 TaxID=2903649 RepID=UPI002E20C4F7